MLRRLQGLPHLAPVFAGVVTGVCSRVFGASALMPVAICLVVAPVAGLALATVAVRGAAPRRQVTPRSTIAGGAATVVVDAPPRLAWLTPLKVDGGLGRLTTAPPSRSRGRWTWRVDALPRGVHRLGPVVVSASDPLGLARRERSHPLPVEIRVEPRVVGLRDAPPAPERGRDAGSDPGSSLAGRYEIAGVRDYRPGDPPSRIHWPQSARRGTLQTVELAGGDRTARRTWVVLDADAAVGESFELAVSAAGSIAIALAEEGALAGLEHSGHTSARVVDGRDLARRVLDLLTVAAPGPAAVDLVSRHAVRTAGRTALVVVSSTCRAPLRAALVDAVSHGLGVRVVLTGTGRAAREALLAVGVEAISLDRLDDLPRVLGEVPRA